MTYWLKSHEGGNPEGVAFVVKTVILATNMDPHELESVFAKGALHPVFFFVLRELFADKGPVYIQKHFSESPFWVFCL